MGIISFFKERKEKKRQEFEDAKLIMLLDPSIGLMIEGLIKGLTDLTDTPVKILRKGGTYYLVFIDGSVYYETRWHEKVGDSSRNMKNTQCILDRLALGKNPMSQADNKVFAALVADRIADIPWMWAINRSYLEQGEYEYIHGRELEIKASSQNPIPEAF